MQPSALSETTQAKESQGREGWFTPAVLNASQAERGQAALPNHELLCLESFSVTVSRCGAFAFSRSAKLELSLIACVLVSDFWPIAIDSELVPISSAVRMTGFVE
jgi:hypothetical protein